MKILDLIPLLKQARLHRNEVVEIDGVSMPKSAAMLMSVFATETDFFVRRELVTCAIEECSLANNSAAVIRLAQAHHQEFGGDISLTILSEALIENNEPEAGLLRAKDALNLAIQNRTFVNCAAGHLVRLAVKTGSVEAVNQAMEALIASTDAPRKEDFVLETDWCDKAEALGADMELISSIRSVAAMQMKISKSKNSPPPKYISPRKI